MKHNQNNQPDNPAAKKNEPQSSQQSPQRSPVDSSEMVNPSEDLVYKGGYSKDPREIVNDPAVAPRTQDTHRAALRGDLLTDPGEDENE